LGDGVDIFVRSFGGYMRKLVAVMLLVLGTSTVLMATPAVPEIDPATGMASMTLLAGCVLIIGGRRKK
jgi:hypothetical protein